MKKYLLAALLLCLSLVLAACGKSKNLVTGYTSGDVTLGEYKGLTYTPESTEVSDEDVEASVKQFLNSNKTDYEVTDRAVESGDTVNIDFVGYMDGTAFDGGTGSTDLQIGSNQFIPGFEDGLIGAELGAKVSLDLTFPDPYQQSPDLAGKPVTFEVTVNSITGHTIPELTDELVAEKTSSKTVEEYRASVRTNLETQAVQNAADKKEVDLIEKAVQNAVYNKDLTAETEAAKTKLIANTDSMYQSYYGVDTFTFFSSVYGFDQDTFNSYMLSQAEMSVKYSYLLSAIAEAEGFEASEDDINALIQDMLSNYGYESEEILFSSLKEQYKADGRKVIADQVKLNKATEIILSTAVAE